MLHNAGYILNVKTFFSLFMIVTMAQFFYEYWMPIFKRWQSVYDAIFHLHFVEDNTILDEGFFLSALNF